MIERGLVAAEETGAACAVIPAYTSDLRVELDGRTVEVPRRIESALIQTPQVFLSSILKNAHAKVTDDVLNDAAMVGRIGVEVVTFNGARSNIKVTAQDDLAMAYGGLLGEFEDMVNRIIYSNGLIGWVENESRSDIGMSHSKEFRVIEIGLEQMHNSLRRIDPGKIEGLNYAQILLAISGFHSLSPQP
ncbi:MAG: 2-C-methyl-D-erythritol 4-phosphate cytidylyltransferase [Dehalococcoidia bacterium]|nr:2-C-methyl-D-erythritol 4-phosphate cytidylyltransferase [Dehalococcoidia bacterium]